MYVYNYSWPANASHCMLYVSMNVKNYMMRGGIAIVYRVGSNDH